MSIYTYTLESGKKWNGRKKPSNSLAIWKRKQAKKLLLTLLTYFHVNEIGFDAVYVLD
jgi:hypothetical protein